MIWKICRRLPHHATKQETKRNKIADINLKEVDMRINNKDEDKKEANRFRC